jgi:O-antigen ligase
LVIFIGLAIITAFWAFRLPPAFKEFAKWIEVLVALLATFDLARNPRDLQPVLILGGLAMAAEAVVGLAQTALGVGPQSFLVRKLIRAYGTFDQPNPFAGYLGLHLPFALAFALRGRRWWRWAALFLWIVGAGAVIFSLSRGAWIAVAVGLLIVVWYSGARKLNDRRLWAAVIATPILILAVGHFSFGIDDVIPERARLVGEGFLDPTDITEEITTGNFAVVQRLAFWTAAGRMFASNPIGGVGLGNYEARYEDFNLGRWADSLGHAHNFYLNMAAETGIIGLLPFLAFLAVVLVLARRAADSAPVIQTAAIASLASIGAFVAHNMVDNVFVGGMGVVFGVAVGLALAANRKWETRVPR